MSESRQLSRNEPVFINVGTQFELCRFPSNGEWSLRQKQGDDVAHLRYLDGLERELVEAALNYSASSENRTYIPPPADANGKRPRLFYWEDAEDCWCPAEGLEVDNIISVGSFFRDGDIEEIRFKREDMTDAEFDAIPEG